MKKDRTLRIATVSTGISVALLLFLDLDRAVNNLSWDSLAFWVPASVIMFWVTIAVGSVVDPIAKKFICDPLVKLLHRL